jgi:hypothetical protein
MTGATPGSQTQYSALTGQWTYSLTFTAQNLSLAELHPHWASVSILSEPQFQWTQSPAPTPAQYAIQAHLINFKWPEIGPLVVSSMIDAQYQWTSSSGQFSVVPGVQLQHSAMDSISVQFGLNIAIGQGPNGGLTATVDPQPAASVWLSGRF